jgi:hypothetical protein
MCIVIKSELEDDDFVFFGYVVGFVPAFGYFTLRELENVNTNDRVSILITRRCG